MLWENTFMVFFNCSAPISVLKRNTLFNQREPSLFQQFHGTKPLIGCPSFFIFLLKIGRNTLPKENMQKDSPVPSRAMRIYFHERNLKLFANQWYLLSVALTGALIQTRVCSTAPNKGIADLWKWSSWAKFEDALRWREGWQPGLDHVLRIPFSMQSNRLVRNQLSYSNVISSVK